MKILIVTSRAAKGIVKEVLSKLKRQNIRIELLVIDKPPIAAAFTAERILEELKKKNNVKRYDYIIVPGLTRGDVSIIEDTIGVKTVKGSIHAIDIPLVIDALLKGYKLSHTEPADKILLPHLIDKIRNMLKEIERNTYFAIEFNGLKIPLRGPPIKLVAEIPFKSNTEEIIEIAQRYVDEGADIITLGTSYNNGNIIDLLSVLLKKLDIPIGIDTNRPKEIIKAVEKGASIVFSLNSDLISKLADYAKDAVYVIIPDKGYENPWDIDTRIMSLKENIEKAIKLGYDKVVVDPILNPVPSGFTATILSYVRIASELKNSPIVFSASNVLEGLEADTIGVLGLLAGIAIEIGASLFHVVEDAAYEYMSVGEAKLALTVNTIAYAMKTHVRNIGLDLLILKDKEYIKTEPLSSKRTVVVESRKDDKIVLDPKGYFKINVLRNKAIELAYYKYTEANNKAEIKFVGTQALSIGRAMLNSIQGLKPDHILYLGYELAKAEIALKLGKNYIQDRDLFQTIKDKLKLVEEVENKDKDT